MSKRILFFIGASYVSGLEIITLHLINEEKKRGNDVHCIICGWNDGVFKQKLNELGISFHEVKLGWIHFRKPLWTLDTLIHYPASYIKCRKIIKEFNPDICHFCSFSNIIMLYPLLKKTGVYNLQETHLPSLKHRIIYRTINRKLQAYTAVSNHIVNVLKNLQVPANKIKLIYNGVPVEPPTVARDTSAGVVKFGIIGQVASWKGHETLIKAVEILKQKSITLFCVQIYGNDKNEYSLFLKELINKKELNAYFEWKGFLKAQSDIYKNVDIVIVPSLSQEPCSLTIIESIMHGKAVVVSDRGGNPELIQHGETGLVFAAEDARALADHIENLLLNRSTIVSLGTKGYKRASEYLTVTRMVDEYDQVYNEILK